ncbi:MAG: pitrilysin family protein [Acidobacteriota bacterium]
MSPEAQPALAFERHTLDNGLRVVLHRDESLPLITVNLWYHVGSKNERPGRTGFAHLFEHVLFQGSENVEAQEHFRYIQQVGGVTNGSTWYDRTNYFETLPAHHLDLGLWLESDRMGFLLPGVTQEKLDTQREVVMNERRQRIDNQPYGLAFERLHEALYPADHPYHWPVIGYMEDIAAASLDDVTEFFRRFYTPNNAVLTLAGSFDPDDALRRVEHFFGPIPRGPVVEPVVAEPPPLEGEQRVLLPDDVKLSRVYLGYRGPRFGEPDWYAGDLLANALSAGKSSLLYRELIYRRQVAQDQVTYLFPTELCSTFYLASTASPETDPAELTDCLDEVLDRCCDELVAEEDLARARNTLLHDYHSELQKLDGRADLLSQSTTLFDDPLRATAPLEHYARLTPEDLQRFARRYLRRDRRVVVTVVPREQGAKPSQPAATAEGTGP